MGLLWLVIEQFPTNNARYGHVVKAKTFQDAKAKLQKDFDASEDWRYKYSQAVEPTDEENSISLLDADRIFCEKC